MRRKGIFSVPGFAGVSAVSNSDFWYVAVILILMKIPRIEIEIGGPRSTTPEDTKIAGASVLENVVFPRTQLCVPPIEILIDGILINTETL